MSLFFVIFLSVSDDFQIVNSAARLSTLLTFAQSVYLMFSAVYVCKETIEHVLLSAGEAQGHHHHAGDESAGTG